MSLLVLAAGGCGADAPSTAQEPATSSSSGAAAGGELDAASKAFLQRLEDGMGEEGSVHVAMRMSGPATMTAEGDSRYGPDGNDMRLSMEMSGLSSGSIDVVLVDGTAYMSMPGSTEAGKFFEIDESNPAMANLDDGLSPADSFAAFEAGLEGVEDLGDEDVDGEPTTHYRLHVDAAAALEAGGQTAVPGVPETLVYDVWIDRDDHMRRMTYELAGTEFTVDMTAWGEDVDIVAPDPEDVVDAPPGM